MKSRITFLFLFLPLLMTAQKKGDKPTGEEGGALKTQTISEDLIVIGSECAGDDCITAEVFGDDTYRAKENNVRFHFDDTSDPAGSFPNNDWRILINDSSSSGANYFAVEDATATKVPFKISSGADDNALFIKDNEFIGLGTGSPATQLHMADGNTPTLRLEQDNTAGFDVQAWDVAGNEANFFIRDASNGSTLPFRIFPGSPSNAIVIEATGDIGLGTVSPERALEIRDVEPIIRLRTVSSTIASWDISSAMTGFGISDVNGGTNPFKIENGAIDNSIVIAADGNIGLGTDTPMHKLHVNGDIAKTGSIIGVSDQRIKTNVHSVTGALAIVNALDGKSYDFKTQEFAALELPDGMQYGLIAQEVEEVLEAIVSKEFIHTTDEDGDVIQLKGVNYEQLIPILINAIKEQDKTIKKLNASSKTTEARLAALEAKLVE